LPAVEALRILEDVLKQAEIDAFKHQQLLYCSSLPLYQNATELPEAPQPPDWLLEMIEE